MARKKAEPPPEKPFEDGVEFATRRARELLADDLWVIRQAQFLDDPELHEYMASMVRGNYSNWLHDQAWKRAQSEMF